MFKKYDDLPAAIAIGIYLIGALFYALQLVFTSESWLATHDIGPAAVPVARCLGAAYFGFSVGLILTFVNGPDGQRTLLIALLATQILTFVILWHAHLMGTLPISQAALDTLFLDVIVVSVLTALLLFGCFKLRSRL